MEEHRAVRDAIVLRDPELAKAAMQKHLRQSQLRFSRNFDERSTALEGAAAKKAVAGQAS